MAEEQVQQQTQPQPSRWELLARERNSRVILCRTPDTYMVLDIARAADRGVRNLRNRFLISLSPEEVIPLLEDYREAIVRLHEATEKICELAGITYEPSRQLQRILDGSGKDTAEEK